MSENPTRDLTTHRQSFAPAVPRGEFHLLSIGINAYRHCPPLQTAVHGAREIARVLVDRYGFVQERVTLLLEEQATRPELIRSLREMVRKLREDDSLLIFYAGHGHLDEFGLGHWVPVEASLSEPADWISNADIKNVLRAAKARHVLLVSDSCFAGDFFRSGGGIRNESRMSGSCVAEDFFCDPARSGPQITDAYVEMAFGKMSRQVLTSGAVEPVLDGGAHGHSVFTYFLLKQLEESRESYVLPQDLFQRIRGGVAVNARQQVQLGALLEAGGEIGGEFVLFRQGGTEMLEATIDEKRRQFLELERLEQEANRAARAQEAVLDAKTEELQKLEARIQELQERLGGPGRRDEELDRFVAVAEQKKQEAIKLARLRAEAEETGRRKAAELERLRREEETKRQAEFDEDCAKWEKIRGSRHTSGDVTEKAWETLCGKWGIPPLVQGRLRRREGKVFLNWENSFGMKFVFVPGTTVLFSIWQTQVQEYDAFARATGRPWTKPGFKQGPNHPALNVSWADANAFCAWLTEKEKKTGSLGGTQTYRLPMDAEWSLAVGLPTEAGNTPAERDMKVPGVYPWGTQWPPPKSAGNYGQSLNVDLHAYTSPVGYFGPNPLGIYDLGGNVWEWCEDWYDAKKAARVLRGASWYDIEPDLLLSSYRNRVRPEFGYDTFGFRVVLVAGASR